MEGEKARKVSPGSNRRDHRAAHRGRGQVGSKHRIVLKTWRRVWFLLLVDRSLLKVSRQGQP